MITNPSNTAIFIMGIVSGCLGTCFFGGLIYTANQYYKCREDWDGYKIGHDADTARYMMGGNYAEAHQNYND